MCIGINTATCADARENNVDGHHLRKRRSKAVLALVLLLVLVLVLTPA